MEGVVAVIDMLGSTIVELRRENEALRAALEAAHRRGQTDDINPTEAPGDQS